MVELIMTTGTEVGALSGEEVQVAKANVVFALKNCPVDGGILTEDGCAFSRESLELLLKKLELVEAQPTTGPDLGREEVKLLSAVVGFALDYCPIEGGMMLDDGVLVSRENLTALREKLASFPGIAQE